MQALFIGSGVAAAVGLLCGGALSSSFDPSVRPAEMVAMDQAGAEDAGAADGYQPAYLQGAAYAYPDPSLGEAPVRASRRTDDAAYLTPVSYVDPPVPGGNIPAPGEQPPSPDSARQTPSQPAVTAPSTDDQAAPERRGDTTTPAPSTTAQPHAPATSPQTAAPAAGATPAEQDDSARPHPV
jgi:hypothetical protein